MCKNNNVRQDLIVRCFIFFLGDLSAGDEQEYNTVFEPKIADLRRTQNLLEFYFRYTVNVIE